MKLEQEELQNMAASLAKLIQDLDQTPLDHNQTLTTIMSIHASLEALSDLTGDIEDHVRRAIVTNVFS
jgi:uncharacterized protein with PhoU and TrkA domain